MEDQLQKQKIKLHIYDTDIIAWVPRNDEELWRKAVQLINTKLNAFYDAFKGKKGDKEIIYMAMIEIDLMAIDESEHNNTSEIANILSTLSSEIEQALSQ